MDDRTQDIKEGAGLDESRLNQEFIDALRKWSSPVLFVLAGLMGLYALTQYLDRQANDKINQAFLQYSQLVESGSPSPASLKALATEHEGVGSISSLARLREADLYLEAVTRGLMPGAEIDPITGDPIDQNDLVNEDSRATLLADANGLYERVVADASDNAADAGFVMSGLFGLASVAEARGDAEGAKGMYARIETEAERLGFPEFAGIARNRASSVDQVIATSELISRTQLPQPEVPSDEAVTEPELSGPDFGTPEPDADPDAESGEVDTGDGDSQDPASDDTSSDGEG